MSAPDRILYVHTDGTIVMHVENDGWSFLNRGPEAHEYVISPEDLRLKHRWLYDIYAGGPDAAGPSSRVYWEGIHWRKDT